MKKSNQFICLIMIMLFLVSVLTINVSANDVIYNWYCVHRNDHKQPVADKGISFVEKYNCYYIDKKHGDFSDDKVIYLTFDAGYENGNVEKILDILEKEEVSGAFFILGHLIEKNPDLVKRMFEDGHLVCNHTYSHKSINKMNKQELENELTRIETLCFNTIGEKMSEFFRPPEGKFNEVSLSHVEDLGYTTVFWSFAYADWDNNNQMSVEKAKEKILDNVHNGEIMLLHPTSETNVLVLPDVIKCLKAQGYRFASLHELRGYRE